MSSHARAQTQSNSLAGTWRIVRFCFGDGATPEPMGPNPIGFLIYTPTGQVSMHAMRTPPTGPIAGGAVQLPSLSALRHLYFSYFGTYTISSDTAVVHHVQGGTLPDYIG